MGCRLTRSLQPMLMNLQSIQSLISLMMRLIDCMFSGFMFLLEYIEKILLVMNILRLVLRVSFYMGGALSGVS